MILEKSMRTCWQMRNIKSRADLNKKDLSKKLVIFDMDQTLVDVFPFHDKAVQKSFKQVFGINGSLRDIDFTGKTIRICFREICDAHKVDKNVAKKNLSKAIFLYKKYFSIPKNISDCVLPGALNLLKYNKNKGNILALVTGSISGTAGKILKNAKLNNFFQVKFFGDMGRNKIVLVKKAILEAKQKLKFRFKKHRVFVIGDSIRDVLSARKNNALGIGVTTGIHSAQKLKKAGAFFVVNSLNDKRLKNVC